MMYEFTDRELRDLIDHLPRVIYAKQRPRTRIVLHGMKAWLANKRKHYRRFGRYPLRK